MDFATLLANLKQNKFSLTCDIQSLLYGILYQQSAAVAAATDPVYVQIRTATNPSNILLAAESVTGWAMLPEGGPVTVWDGTNTVIWPDATYMGIGGPTLPLIANQWRFTPGVGLYLITYHTEAF